MRVARARSIASVNRRVIMAALRLATSPRCSRPGGAAISRRLNASRRWSTTICDSWDGSTSGRSVRAPGETRPRWCTKRLCGWWTPERSTGRTAPIFSRYRLASCAGFSSTLHAPAPPTKRGGGMQRVDQTSDGESRRCLPRGTDRAAEICALDDALTTLAQKDAAPCAGHRAAVFRRAERRRNGRNAWCLSADRHARLEAGAGLAGSAASAGHDHLNVSRCADFIPAAEDEIATTRIPAPRTIVVIISKCRVTGQGRRRRRP